MAGEAEQVPPPELAPARNQASLASSVVDFGAFETHEAYAARLKSEHGRKSRFWG